MPQDDNMQNGTPENPITISDYIAALPDGALVLDRDETVIDANALAIDLLQVHPVGIAASSVVRSPQFLQAVQSARQTGESGIVDADFWGKPTRQVRIHISTLGKGGWLLVILRDISREQAIEKMRSDFVANASHEMRTPLASIIGSVETLQGAAKNDPKAREMFLSTMLTQAARMKRLIDDLLTLSRIELNEHVKPQTKALLSDVARQAIGNLANTAKEAGITVSLIGTEKFEVAGDPDELLQVAQNLLENAIKYGGAGGRVELNCYAQGGIGYLSVRDFGKGIADIHLPRLTERFYRVSTQESRSRGGTGLGLAIVKHIMVRHRGNLTVTSTEGQGSTFTISIPLSKS